MRSEYLDWDTQPSLFKHYPHFCYRISLSKIPQLHWIRHLRSITEFQSVAYKPYYRLNTPSAGNLHPIEIYLQIRNIDGVLSGIYHWDVLHEELVLIEEIASGGIEPFLGMEHRFSGCILLFSLVPFRSSWKYGLRAWRYLYLDLGHQLGEMHGVLHSDGIKPTKLSHINNKALQNVLSFGGDEQLCAVYAIGVEGEKKVKPLDSLLIRVAPCDYTRDNAQLSEAIDGGEVYVTYMPQFGKHWTPLIHELRRSARRFDPFSHQDAWCIEMMALPVPESLEVIHIVFRAHSMHMGVYQNGVCIQEGNFITEIVHLLLDQRFIAHASMVSLIFSDRFESSTHIEAGIYAQECYTLAEQMNAGCSGIGAFFDDDASRWSKNPLLYAVAIGGKQHE